VFICHKANLIIRRFGGKDFGGLDAFLGSMPHGIAAVSPCHGDGGVAEAGNLTATCRRLPTSGLVLRSGFQRTQTQTGSGNTLSALGDSSTQRKGFVAKKAFAASDPRCTYPV
jgi:hypothetical protein